MATSLPRSGAGLLERRGRNLTFPGMQQQHHIVSLPLTLFCPQLFEFLVRIDLFPFSDRFMKCLDHKTRNQPAGTVVIELDCDAGIIMVWYQV